MRARAVTIGSIVVGGALGAWSGGEAAVAAVANQQAPAMRPAPEPRALPSPNARVADLDALASVACLGAILVYDENTNHKQALAALDTYGLPYTRAMAADFVSLLTGASWDLVIMDLPSTEPADATWTSLLASHITSGGRALHSHWSPSSLTPELQAAFEIRAGASHDTLTFYEWPGCHRLFLDPESVPGVFDVWLDDVWGINGFRVDPTGSAVAAAGFSPFSTPGDGAIVIGNAGRTIFNGFLFDDFRTADKDLDAVPDMVELLMNQLASFCSTPGCCGDLDLDPGEDCDEGGRNTPTCDSDCTLPVCGDDHINLAAGEVCDRGGIDVATCDADCTFPECGDGHLNLAAGEECEEGSIDTLTCDADCTLPLCGDFHANLAAGEACDGGGVDAVACDFDCSLPRCGDGHINLAAGEECEEGTIDTATCDADCTLPSCGDGHSNLAAGEECDDGGTTPGDGCDESCLIEDCLGALSPLRLLKGVKEAPGARFFWDPDLAAPGYHLNEVSFKGDLGRAWRTPKGIGVPVCETLAGTTECLDAMLPPPASPRRFLQVVAACGDSGLDEGPF